MKRNIIVAKKAISPELCNNIINKASNFQEGGVGLEEGIHAIDHKTRRSEVFFLSGSIPFFDIYKPFTELVRDVNERFYNFNLYNPETFQITKYDEKNQGFYKPHIDGFYDNPKVREVRKLSMSVQLTAPEYYEGGKLVFPDDEQNFNYEDSKEQGTVVFFPSYLRHGVTPVTKGTRYSLVSWFLGPHFS